MSKDSDGQFESLQLSYKSNAEQGNGIDLTAILGGKVDGSVREAFYRLYDYFKDQMRAKEDQYREQVLFLERRLEQERQKRREAERVEESRTRSEMQQRGVLTKKVQDLRRSLTTSARISIGASCLSLIFASSLGVDRLANKPADPVAPEVVEQLKERVASYDAVMRSREEQLERFMYGENDKFGALLKAVDALKAQVGLMDWYLKDDTRDLLESLKEFVQQQRKANDE